MNELLSLLNSVPRHAADPVDPPEMHLHAVSTRPGPELIPGLLDAIDRSCGWVLHRQMMGASLLQMRIETQGRALMELYGSFLEQGLDLAQDSHRMLTERCSCARLHRRFGGGILIIHLQVQLPANLSLPSQWLHTRVA